MASLKQLEAIERLKKAKLEREHKLVDGIDYKFCSIHHTHFPGEDIWFPATTEYFYYHSKNKSDYLYPYCKRCASKKGVQQWRDDPIKHREAHRRYEKTKKFKIWMRKNQMESVDYMVQYRKDNPEKMRGYTKNHRIHDITEAEWRRCLKIFDYRCAYCGITQEESLRIHKQKLHKDHVDYEGYNDLRNAVPACRSCNSKKHQYNMETWFKEEEYFNEESLSFIYWWIIEGYKDYIEDKPPYRIIKEKNKDNDKFHWNLWTVNEYRNTIEIVITKNKKKEITIEIERGILNEILTLEVAK